ncbi:MULTISPECIES: universal stress protein [Natrialbaceae]|uniref:universal stress protein n=1 Tax=Natrialbaceae TaxID=1644061 RepID=UPI00207CAB2D|nr:universal stress protein [Natronococcus sp. CG52]
MDRLLVVVDDSETHRQLLEKAGTIAAGVGCELVVLDIVDENEFTGSVQRQANRGGQGESFDEVTTKAAANAQELADEVLADEDIEYDVLGVVGKVPDDILTVAEKQGCDHIFVAGRKRSPTGKAVFGDTAQSVILNFDGPVTVLTDNS